MKKINLEKTINSVAYVIWSLSLWMLSYFQGLDCSFISFREDYLKTVWCLIFAGICLYGNSKQELRHEMFKSFAILVGSAVLDNIYNQNNEMKKIILQVVVLFVYQSLAYMVLLMIGQSSRLHGKKAKKLAIIFMLVIGALHFVMGLNYFISFMGASTVALFVGVRYYLQYMKESGDVYAKVKYKGGTYSVNILDKVKIEGIKAILLAKRVKRRIFLLIPNNFVLYLGLTFCWVLFGIFTYYVGIDFKSPQAYTVKDVMWELKNSYFTSVVLALCIAGYSQNSGYKKRIEVQHDFYVDSMRTFDHLFKIFIGNEVYHYMPFYNRECLNDTLEYIKELEVKDCEVTLGEFKINLEEILEQLEKIEYERRNNNIVGMHKERLGDDIQRSKNLIKQKLKQCNNLEQIKDATREVANSLFYIIADIRRPWRWDIENDKKILGLLAKYEGNGIEDDFYYSMHLYGHKFD